MQMLGNLFSKGKTYKIVIRRTETDCGIYTLTVSDENELFVEGLDKYNTPKKLAKNAIIEIAEMM